ncbi:MAG: UDP-N-acetylmuramoyl-L-alanine--D-glutamate ligase, partial [Patescibacteria group bacterium]|nr:UDP-N-acetylmuramoyl-L-alanine--D-glutamate ligase [Patescibacteria group bacterium]
MSKIKLENLRNQKVGVLGLGKENIALVEFLNSAGLDIVVCDEKSEGDLSDYREEIKDLPVQFRLGPHYLDHLEDFKVVFRTPGLPYLNPKIQEAKGFGVEISSQIKLFFNFCPCPIIGVTGTKGKGTTATLIYEILKWKSKIQNQKSKIYLGGNIGTPPIEFLDK